MSETKEVKPISPVLFPRLFDLAHKAGLEAAQKVHVQPMIVQEHTNMLDDHSPVVREYHVASGVCGFAWVTIRPGNCQFANWMKKNKDAGKAYGGGMQYWIREFGQSMTRKEAYADAFAKVLREFCIHAHSGSRLD